MDQLRRDLSYAVRMLFRRPGLSLIIVVTFALGIGLTFAVFSIVNGALYKGLPFEDADRLLALGRTDASRNIQFMNVSVHDFVDWSEQQTTFEGLSAVSIQTVNLALVRCPAGTASVGTWVPARRGPTGRRPGHHHRV